MNKLFNYRNLDLGLLLVRIAVGVIFIYHGWDKFQNIDMTIGFFAKLGFPAFLAYAIAALELLGGIAILIGLWVQYFSLLLAATMIVALITVKIPAGFLPAGDADIALLASNLLLFLAGGGRYVITRLKK